MNLYFKTKLCFSSYSINEQVKEFHRLSIDIKEIISNILKKFPKNISHLLFTNICPIHITNRKYAITVFVELLGEYLNKLKCFYFYV